MDQLLLFIERVIPVLWQGTIITLQLASVSLLLGMALGLPLGVLRVYGPRWAQRIVALYVLVFQGTPLLVQLFIIYYGLPELGIAFSQTIAAYLALGLNSAAYQAEYLRGSINAIGAAQMQAGRSIGLTKWQTIGYVILPQALRLALPSWSNEPISLLKTTAIVFLIAVQDLMAEGKRAATTTFDFVGIYLAIAVVYLVMVFTLDALLKFLERKTKIPGMDIETRR